MTEAEQFNEKWNQILSLSSALTLVHSMRYMQDDILALLGYGRPPNDALEALDNAFQSLSQVELRVADEVRNRVAQIAPQEGSEDAPGTTED